MPLEIKVTVKCDGCAAVLDPERTVKQSEIDGIRWKWTRRAVAVERVRRATRFYCAKCADSAAD